MRALRRRDLLQGSLALAGLGVLSGCGILPARTQPARIARVAYQDFESEATYPVNLLEAFRSGLRDLGYVEGQNLSLEIHFADSRSPEERFADLARKGVDVIVTRGGNSALTARRVTGTVPIVVVYAGDPVGLGLVASLARPGGNVTGLALLEPEVATKRLQLLQEMAPGISRVGVLYNPDDPSMELTFQSAVSVAGTLGVQIQPLGVRQNELEAPLAAAIAERVDALMIIGSGFGGQRAAVVDFAARQRLPAIYTGGEWAAAGGLMSYGVDFADLFRRAATYVDKILKGTSPAELPVEGPTRFEFVVNLKVARALGLTIPQSVLAEATEIIQ